MTKHRMLFCTDNYTYLKRELMQRGEFEEGQLQVQTFPDGERYMRVIEPVEGREVILLGGTISDTETLQLYDLACALVKQGAIKLTMIVPYFGYSTMERAAKRGEVVTAKTRSRLISAIPEATHGNHILLLDLHSEGLQYYFEGALVTKHLYAKAAIIEALKKYAPKQFVLGSTDAGRAKWVESLAYEMHVGASFVLKRRLSATETELAAVSAHVEGMHVCLYDDMIRTGSTLVTAARAYLEAGATSVSAFATHGVLPGDSLKKLKDSNLLQTIICTNSHPHALELEDDFLHVVSIADILITGLSTGF